MIQPLHDYIVLEEIKPEKGALVVNSDEPNNRGRVVSEPSSLLWTGDSVVKAGAVAGGDTVVFMPHMFTRIRGDGGKEFLIGKYEYIIAVIK